VDPQDRRGLVVADVGRAAEVLRFAVPASDACAPAPASGAVRRVLDARVRTSIEGVPVASARTPWSTRPLSWACTIRAATASVA
jgi:hypothetical protein